ncbi:DUF1343 domain-containing protein [bacterium]|nr:DUF1343 domain-containing protein [bacterium]
MLHSVSRWRVYFPLPFTMLLVCMLMLPRTGMARGTLPRDMSAGPTPAVKLGCEVLLSDSLHLINGKRVGLLCNHTSLLSNGVALFDTLRQLDAVELAAVFTPEHGFTGSADAGLHVSSGRIGDIPQYSLYGNTRRPTHEMLSGIDVLLMDLQDVGARYYTYITTMMFCLEEAAKTGTRVVVLDRPNPLGGVQVEGPIRDDSLQSFVSYLPVPVRHGMTAGELARMAIGEGWLRGGVRPFCTVVPMRGWKREMVYEDTGLPWRRPSPNIISPEAALAYVGTCLFEGSNISEGRGTAIPFLLIGAPFVDGAAAVAALNGLHLPGVRFSEETFTPESRPGARHPRYEGERCGGIRLQITDARSFPAWRCGVEILRVLRHLHHGKVRCTSYLSLLTGIARPCTTLSATLRGAIDEDIATFRRVSLPYLLYH